MTSTPTEATLHPLTESPAPGDQVCWEYANGRCGGVWFWPGGGFDSLEYVRQRHEDIRGWRLVKAAPPPPPAPTLHELARALGDSIPALLGGSQYIGLYDWAAKVKALQEAVLALPESSLPTLQQRGA